MEYPNVVFGYGILVDYRLLAKTFKLKVSKKYGRGDVGILMEKYLENHLFNGIHMEILEVANGLYSDSNLIFFGKYMQLANDWGANINSPTDIKELLNIIESDEIIDVCINYFGKVPQFMTIINGA